MRAANGSWRDEVLFAGDDSSGFCPDENKSLRGTMEV